MRRSKTIFVASIFVASLQSYAVSADAIVWTYQYLLATAHTELELAPVIEHIVEDELPDNELSDFAAEMLLARSGDASYPARNKTGLLRVLAAARSHRYDAVRERLRAQARGGSGAHWTPALNWKFIMKEEAEYVPGSIDIRGFLARVEAAALAAKPTTAQGRHLAQFPGGTIEELFEWAGRPHHITARQNRASDGSLVVKVQRLTFYYRGLGRVVYAYRAMQGEWLFQTVLADPLAFEHELPYRARAADLGLPDSTTLEMMQLVSDYTISMKLAIELNYRRGKPPLEFLDTAAEILATQFKSSTDPVRVDMYAWICRLLTQHGGPRYAAVLQTVAQNGDAELSRFAQLRMGHVTDVPVTPYVPGTISLSAQRGKYPSPYPESTFQGGRL
jgi:hypothetical protein